MEINKTLKEYLDELASNSPTPGGGNVAALCGTLAAALGTMVAKLTIGKKKYAAVESEVTELKIKLGEFVPEFINLARNDNAAFDEVMNAFKLPKDTDNEKKIRSTAINAATLGAAKVPAGVIDKCSELLPLLSRISEIGNQNSLSDAAVGISLTRTSAEGAFLNVLINCSALPEKDMYNDLLSDAHSKYEQIKATSEDTLNTIINKLKPQI